MTTVLQQMKMLAPRLQLNTLGLPEGIYRPDLLPAPPRTGTSYTPEVLSSTPGDSTDTLDQLNLFSEDAPPTQVSNLPVVIPPRPLVDENYEQDLKAAFTLLDYSEGYPTLDGMPFWSQLPFESPSAYACFNAYLQQGRTGARQLFLVLEDPSVRALRLELTVAELEEYFHLYYWNARVKAHDMFFLAHRQKERERRAIETEDAHFLQAARLMGIVEAYLDEKGEELIETMTPAVFLKFFQTAAQIQRLSVGLSSNGGQGQQTPQGASTEVILRTIAQQNANVAVETDKNESIEHQTATKSEKLQRILSDPKLLGFAQEIVIRTSTGQQGAQ